MLKLVRYTDHGAPARIGLLDGDAIADLTDVAPGLVDLVAALNLKRQDLLELAERAGRTPLDGCRLLAPIAQPSKIFCVGKNSRKHREELVANGMLNEDPQEPTGFVKLVSTMVGDHAEVERPDGITTLDYEPELTFIVSKPAFRVKGGAAQSFVGGITVLNDMTAREIQKQEVKSGTKFWTAKNMPGFCPVGPAVVPLYEIADAYDLWLTCSVNGEQRLRVNTNEHIFRIEQILEHFTRYMPFEPGDLIATGAPRGTAISHPNAAELYMRPGDTCVAGIEGLMELTTHIIAAR